MKLTESQHRVGQQARDAQSALDVLDVQEWLHPTRNGIEHRLAVSEKLLNFVDEVPVAGSGRQTRRAQHLNKSTELGLVETLLIHRIEKLEQRPSLSDPMDGWCVCEESIACCSDLLRLTSEVVQNIKRQLVLLVDAVVEFHDLGIVGAEANDHLHGEGSPNASAPRPCCGGHPGPGA